MQTNNQPGNDEFGTGKIKKILLGIVGILVVIPSLINAGTDIYHSIMNSPIGGSEVINTNLMKNHWEEQALFKKDIEIKRDSVAKVLKLRVYENADIWVKYGSQEQWLASSDGEKTSVMEISLVGNAFADDGGSPMFKKMSSPVLTEELQPVTVNLGRIKSEKSRSLSKPAQTIERSYLFAQKNNSHQGFTSTKKFTKSFSAVDGFVIRDAKIDIMSTSNASSPKISISQDKKTVTLEVELKSGPFYDRWEGWLKASVITNQQKEK